MRIKIGKFNPLESDIFKYIITPAIGFGIGGAIWGYMFANMAFLGDPGNPFAYLTNGVVLGAIGALSLSIFSTRKRYILRNCVFGVAIGISSFFIGYIIGDALAFPLVIIGGIFSHLIAPISDGLSFLILSQAPNFFIAGCIIGFLFSFLFKKKVLPMALSGAFSFPLGYIVGIPTGSLFDNYLAESLFSLYLPRFIITGIVLGTSLGLVVYRSKIKIISGGDNHQ